MKNDTNFGITEEKPSSYNGINTSCVIIVMYNRVPELAKIFDAINTNIIEGLIVVNNSANNQLQDILYSSIPNELSSCIHLYKNYNIDKMAGALNLGIREAIKLGYSMVFLLDDDAHLSDNFFRIQLENMNTQLSKGVKVGILCPIVSNDEHLINKQIGKASFSEIKYAITSGSLLNINAVLNTSLYDTRFPLEAADLMFSILIRESGSKILRFNKVLVTQDFGTSLKQNSFLALIYKISAKLPNHINFYFDKGNAYFNYAFYYSPEREADILKNFLKLKSVSEFHVGLVSIFLTVIRQIFNFLILGDRKYLSLVLKEVFR
jgi:GT2 family glycosyltransferase